MSELRSRLQRTRLRILRFVVLFVFLSGSSVAETAEVYSLGAGQLNLLKNLESNLIEYPKQQPKSRVVNANIQCKKLCNYQPVESEDVQCFGSFKSVCSVSQLFADGHVLDTKISVNCIGGFKNVTAYSGNAALVDTECRGQFQQIQDMNVYEQLIESEAMEGFTTFVKTDTYHTSYSCRHLFTVSKKLQLDDQMEASMLSGSVEMTCDGAQDIRVETGYCSCSKECAKSLNIEKVFTFNAADKQMVMRANVTLNPAGGETYGDRMEAENFRKVAVHDPKLAHKVAHAIVDPVKYHRQSGVEMSDIHPLIWDYHSTENVYAFKDKLENSKWSSQSFTSWLHILCNGESTPYQCRCNGVLSANIRFGQSGSAFLMCQGGWNAYEDVTYVCNGLFTEDESEHNDFGTYFTKISRCDGTLAISPLSSIPEDGMKYYGLSEICVGASTVQSTYALEDLDHRYLAHVIDPRTAEQAVCLMADKNCKQLRYLTQ